MFYFNFCKTATWNRLTKKKCINIGLTSFSDVVTSKISSFHIPNIETARQTLITKQTYYAIRKYFEKLRSSKLKHCPE